jgi:hypothetical protein
MTTITARGLAGLPARQAVARPVPAPVVAAPRAAELPGAARAAALPGAARVAARQEAPEPLARTLDLIAKPASPTSAGPSSVNA